MKKWWIIGIIVLLVASFFVVGFFKPRGIEPSVYDFESCVAEGNAVMESYPRQCRDLVSDKTFTEKIDLDLSSKPNEAVEDELEIKNGLDVVYKTDNLPVPSWLHIGGDAEPWVNSIYLARSQDGKSFSGDKFFVQHAGVPNLLLTNDGKVVAVFQYFSYEDEAYFDRIAYTVSEDKGETWSDVKLIDFDPEFDAGPTPVDPTLVQLNDGRFRLYFTYHKHGMPYAALFSVISTNLDGEFKSEGMQLSTDEMLLDPAVVFFKDEWHHYTVNHENGESIHSVSDDGLNFERKDDIKEDFQFLGGAIEDDGKMRFYGTGRGVVLAESDDGYSFSKVKENVVEGADPGVIKFSDGSYLITYTKI